MNRKEHSYLVLREWLQRDSVVYSSLNHVSASGNTKVFSLYVPVVRNWSPEYGRELGIVRIDSYVSTVTGDRYNDRWDGIEVKGIGHNAAESVVSDLAYKLYDDSLALKHERL